MFHWTTRYRWSTILRAGLTGPPCNRTSLLHEEEEEPFMARALLDKVWDAHTVRTLPSGQTQLLIGLHLVHEVTTPQAFQMLRDSKLKVRMPERTFGTLD